jgi:GT2 family glycosyltransferase
MNKHSEAMAIGIVSYERPRITQRCIDSIRATSKIPYHIYIADNGSPSQMTKYQLAIWEKQEDITVIRLDMNKGPAGGRNPILDMVSDRHEVIAMLDNDCIVLNGWDSSAGEAIAAGCDVVCPKLLETDMQTVQRGPTRPWPGEETVHPEYIGRGGSRYAPEVNNRQKIDLFPGTAIFKTSVFRRVGFYDANLWIAEDYDLSFRATAAGICICYEPECEIVHDHVFDMEYEKVRTDPSKSLISHIVMWGKHRKLLLSPSSLRLYHYLVKNNVPMWTTKKRGAGNLIARIRRRALGEYFCRRYGEVWASKEEGARITEKIISEKIVNIERS